MSTVTRRRQDIQGLRAVAVLLVALDHAGLKLLKGGYVGVDVFFVLSGYLITGLLVSAAERASGHEYFRDFYARRARRILPAATLTLIVTDVAASHLLNLYRAHQVLVDSLYSTFFVANVHFSSIGTNYFATGQPPSPFQHFWSLSVEEQFYLVWPLFVAVILLGITLRGRPDGDIVRRRRTLGIGAVVVTLGSLAFAVYDTHHSPVTAYFSTPARLWELGLGAILFLNARRVARLPGPLLAILGWIGLAAIVLASIRYSPSTAFPGLPALLPTVGAAAVIAAGLGVRRAPYAPSRLLSLLPFRYVGDRSYTFYLWHWPVLILAMEHAGHSLSLTTNLILLGGAFGLSVITYSVFERPIHYTQKLQGAAALALWPAAIAVVFFVSSLTWSHYQDAVNLTTAVAPEIQTETNEAPALASSATTQAFWHPSSPDDLVAAVAAVRASRPIPTTLTPSALDLKTSGYGPPPSCNPEETEVCSFPTTSGKKSLVVFGDSYAVMWMPAILSFAQREGYQVHTIMHFACFARQWAGNGHPWTRKCEDFYKFGVAKLRALHPSLLIVSTRYSEQEEPEAAIHNISLLGATVRAFVHRIVVIADPPEQEKEPTDCLLSAHATMSRCSIKEAPWQIDLTASAESATKTFGVFLDTVPWFCYHEICPMVIGHSVVKKDQFHLTERYVEELAPLFISAVTRLLRTSETPSAPPPGGLRAGTAG